MTTPLAMFFLLVNHYTVISSAVQVNDSEASCYYAADARRTPTHESVAEDFRLSD